MAVAATTVPRARVRRLLDVVIVAWIATWAVLGFLVAREVQGLRGVTRAVTAAGVAIELTGEGLASFEGAPFVGDEIGRVAEETIEAGRSAQQSGRSSRESIDALSVLLGISIALAPTLPPLALYLPLRAAWRRQLRGLERALAEAPDDPALEEFLARRAAQNLPYERLRELGENPWRDLENGNYRRLAEAELERLGLRRRSRGA